MLNTSLPKLQYDEKGRLVRLNAQQREQIVIYYYSNNVSQKNLAEQVGCSPQTMNALLNNPKWLKRAREYLKKEMDKADIRRTLARIKAIEASPDAIGQIIKIAMQDVDSTPQQYQYVIQNAAHEILDRAGIKPVEEDEKKEVRISFGDFDFKPEMPTLDEGIPMVDVTDSVPEEEGGSVE